ncbi:PQQ-binding-like beta-propeller repeat protein [Danxiaibacter flavus]|uniref:PQQ-binding-like beta-propeller repeat protein n=1 Tax=Danxiaibacter flavus TaxID=3049108 RepID=A0ABV3ZE17_9BACT|nr:PQQ-binding-like beta-propeller repeat protein [Chitinophagaceae bacterium DXS]
MIHTPFAKLTVAIFTLSFFVACKNETPSAYTGWSVVNGNATGNKYSSLEQIDTTNVQRLQVAWTYNTGDADTAAHSQIQCNPIIVDGIMYATSPQLKLIAVDAATGKEKWVFKPFEQVEGDKEGHFILNNNRGVAYWTDGKDDKRIFYTAGSFVHAVNATTGKLIESFGNKGKIDLHDDLGADVHDLFVTATSAPTVYKDLVITGTRVSEGMDAAPGHIRAYDVRTGKMRWIFHTIPQPGEPGYETWEDKDAWKMVGGANNWMGLTVDHQRGIAYVPIGSASMDFYGGKKLGSNLYADCMLALDAATGKLKWHFQFIHHDTWDWDPSSAPVLTTIQHEGKDVDVVAQTTKTGFVFVFDRETGKSIFPIKETPVDTATKLVGEKLWPTQPVPQKPAPFVRQTFGEKDINPYLPKESYEDVKSRLKTYHTGMFTPQSKEGTVIFPGFDGGAEWGGPAVDPESGLLYVNANEMAWILHMLDVDKTKQTSETYIKAGVRLYKQHCMSCHGPERKGGGNYPSIVDVNKKLNEDSFIDFINHGRRMMPAFQYLKQEEKEAIASFVLDIKSNQQKKFVSVPTAAEVFRNVPYTISGYIKFLSKEGLPAIAPPWGTLTAINLNTGEHVWKTTLGEEAELKARGVPPTGTENYGGPVVTKGGLLFIGASKDGKFRAFSKATGTLLWETNLPAPAFATPAVYSANGRQYVVVACGGGKLGTKSGDAYVAFALPEKNK